MSFTIKERLQCESQIQETICENMQRLLEEEREAVRRMKQEERYRSKIDFLEP